MTEQESLARRFETQRPRLRSAATQLLGSVADADDAVQETWLRLQRTDDAEIRSLDAWLTTVVSRVSLDILRAPRRSRERSWQVEPWRDEPPATEPDPAEVVANSDRVSVALLVVLETLSPAERIAFVLHDVFGQSFDEVAGVLDRSPAAARQLASRARRRVRGASEPTRMDGHVVSILSFTTARNRITALHVLADPRQLAELDVDGLLDGPVPA